MEIAITGGTGFIGKRLAQFHLARGDAVRLLSRRPESNQGVSPLLTWHQGDLGGDADLRSFAEGADILYHCAGEIRDPTRMEAVHVTGTQRLVAAAAGRARRWVQLSSVGVYGQPRAGMVTEQSPLCPVGTYEITKKISDDLVLEAGRRGAFEWSILRPSIVFGEEMPNQSLFQMVRVIERGQFFFIGKPGASANYVHVDNVIHALTRCALRPEAAGEIFNLSDYATMESFVGLICAALGVAPPQKHLPESLARAIAAVGPRLVKRFPLTASRVDALTSRAIYPIDHIQRALGYQHVTGMEDGVARLVQAWRAGAARPPLPQGKK